ncbi:MAG: UDP-4-amino-4,6-dideoxy-N-acetyl-beta-L-altrosamine transaminase [Deltaproteobacteria bacterium]|nr:UDP-4-amino-4,6-dideoxy-N-acetyl-beta-L-altrosamine transaminase [Deltaproteobacteria bacterium]
MTNRFIPYGRQTIDEDDIQAVIEVLKSDWLTTGPLVEKFEQAVADFVGAEYAVAVSSGTAALHAAMYAIGVGPGDEVIVPPMTFAATANAVVFQGGTPVFVDVEESTLLIDPEMVEAMITPCTKAIVAVDYAGQPCNYEALQKIADRHGLFLIADACHSIGGKYKECRCGGLADLTIFSFHPVKHITTGEGGMIVTDNVDFAEKMRRFRNHGIATDHRRRTENGTWYYEMVDIGYNYRITDFQCALGLSQLRKLPGWIVRRRDIAHCYDDAFAEISAVRPLDVSPDILHAYHLYVLRFNLVELRTTRTEIFSALVELRTTRTEIFSALREQGIGVNVHYIPVHLHPFYRERFGCRNGDCPVAETAYEQIISLPVFPAMADKDVSEVIRTVSRVVYEVPKV